MQARRALFGAVGSLCVGLAAAGAVLPGLPTTPFLLVAAWCFARSMPEWTERVLAWRLFRPFAPFVVGAEPVPLRVRLLALGIVWAAIGLSVSVLVGAEQHGLAVAVVLAGAMGSVVVVRFGRGRGDAERR